MKRHTLALAIFVPVGVYLVAMLALAIFVLKPPALGWIGLGGLSAFLLLAGGAGLWLFPRMRTNAVRLHPHPADEALYRLLVVLEVDVEAAELCSAVRLRLIGRDADVRVVAPVVVSPLHFVADDEGREDSEAHRRLRNALRALAEAGIRAQGTIGADDPLEAAGDELPGFPADEILLVGALESSRGWLDEGFESRARDLFGVPVATVFGRAAATV